MPANSNWELAEIMVGIVVSWLGSFGALAFSYGKLSNRVKSTEDGLDKVEGKFKNRDGESLFISRTDCERTQMSCQKVMKTILDGHDSKFQEVNNRFDRTDDKIDKHFADLYDKLNDLRD